MSLAILFAGQGTQHAAMMPWLESCAEATPTLSRRAAQLGGDWRSRLAGPDWGPESNAVAQPLLTSLSLAAWQGLTPHLPAPAVVAGYSVGELAAFCAAGVFDGAQAMALASDLAAAMDRSAAMLDTGLLSVQGPDAKSLLAACERHGLSLALRLSAAGARCTRLSVRVASHTPWMLAAAAEFEARLGVVPMSSPQSILDCNHSGAAEREPAHLKHLLARQIATTVLWDSCIDAIAERRIRCVLEVGAGHALTDLWRDRYPGVPARSVDEFRSAQVIARWVSTVLR